MIFKRRKINKNKVKKIEIEMKTLHSVHDFNKAIYLIDNLIKVTEQNLGYKKKNMSEFQHNLSYLNDFRSFLNMYRVQVYGNFIGLKYISINNEYRLIPSRFPRLFILKEKIKQFFRKLFFYIFDIFKLIFLNQNLFILIFFDLGV